MDKYEQSKIDFLPNSQLLITNSAGNTMNCLLDFGEYGSIELEVLAGGVITHNQGTKPCSINIMEPKNLPGVSGIVKNSRTDF